MGAPKTSDGKPIFSVFPLEGTKTTHVTPNWCDPTTWYQQSNAVTDEVLTSGDAGAGTVWNLSHTDIIDVYHGKLTGEDRLKGPNNADLRVSVKVDGVSKTEQDPHYASGGDFALDYKTGMLTLLTPAPGAVVTASYHHSGTSEFVIAPDQGKKIRFNLVEAQFSADIQIKDSCVFSMYGYAFYFAPQLVAAQALQPNDKIKLGQTTYKTLLDFMNDANGPIPTVPGLDAGNWRGLPCTLYVFMWQYIAMTTLMSSAGMEVRIKLEHDTPYGGSISTATFYGIEEDE